jgi:hypothetical protein
MKTIKALKTINFFGIKTPIRFLFFLFFGILCGILVLLSFTLEADIFARFGTWFRAFPFMVLFFYPLLWIIFNNKDRGKVMLCAPDVLFYVAGGIIGLVLFLLIELLLLLEAGLFSLIKLIF